MDRSAVFIDRDDTLMIDVGYCNDPDLVRLLPGAAEGVRQLRNAGYLIVIATNQSGIGRGYFDSETLEAIHERLRHELLQNGADFDAVYYCPHIPAEGCECRKPKPGLLLRAASELGIDLQSSYAVGDRDIDIQAGKAAGTRTILVLHGHAKRYDKDASADIIVENLAEAASSILTGTRSRGGREGSRIPLRS